VTAPHLSSDHLILSHRGFQYFVTYLTGGAAAYWVVIDSVRLRRALRGDRGKGAVRDQIFGSLIGLVIGAIGLVGAYLGMP
jgi:hypothetical protein